MQINWKYIGIWAALVGLSACESEELPQGNTEAPCAVFHIESRAGETLKEEALRLFIADRREEHQLNEALHCGLNDRIDLKENTYSIEKIVAQWYKFAFISVPDFATDETDGTKMFTVAKDASPETCDFNQLVVDYAPILEHQKTNPGAATTKDLHVWRAVKDRWLKPDTTLTENVTLNRVTGELVLNMGIPEDQFRKQVTSMEVYLYDVPQKIFIGDDSEGKVYTESAGEYTFKFMDIPWNKGKDYLLTLALPPHAINGFVLVNYGKTDGTDAGKQDVEVFRINQGEGQKVVVKSDTRTTVLFNGIPNGEYEVRYAGFSTTGGIGVADDEWNAWK